MPAAATDEQDLSAAGVRFIAGFEGFSPRLYNDPCGHCTIGYGHLVHLGRCNGNEPADFKREITRDQGFDLLRQDTKAAERAVNQRVQVVLTQYQFDALVGFVFNVGAGAFGGSTLLRRLNQGDYKAVPAELMRWVIPAVDRFPAWSGAVGPKVCSSPKEPTALSMRLPTPKSRSRHTPLSMRLPTPTFRESNESAREPTSLRSPTPIIEIPLVAAAGSTVGHRHHGQATWSCAHGYPLSERGQVVVEPARAVDEEFVDMVVGADEENMLAVVAERVAGQGAGGGGGHGAGQAWSGVVGPARAGDEELVDVAVGADEEDVLAVVVSSG